MKNEEESERFDIRPAAPGEAAPLTQLAVRSKSHWGYDAEFVDDSRADLTVTPESIVAGRVFVAESGGGVAGFYSLSGEGLEAELELLFVEPRLIGEGVGRALWRHAAATARRLGFRELVVASDPFAEPFYRAVGAVRVGFRESPVRAGRMLPLLRYPLA
jgi:GNAT superfamily N-acetyltransferase